jgi:hypothetical protein
MGKQRRRPAGRRFFAVYFSPEKSYNIEKR